MKKMSANKGTALSSMRQMFQLLSESIVLLRRPLLWQLSLLPLPLAPLVPPPTEQDEHLQLGREMNPSLVGLPQGWWGCREVRRPPLHWGRCGSCIGFSPSCRGSSERCPWSSCKFSSQENLDDHRLRLRAPSGKSSRPRYGSGWTPCPPCYSQEKGASFSRPCQCIDIIFMHFLFDTKYIIVCTKCQPVSKFWHLFWSLHFGTLL